MKEVFSVGDIKILGISISLGTMIFQAVIFTILIYVLKNKYLSKLLDALEKRRDSIANKLMLAESYKKEAEEELLKQRELTKNAVRDSKRIITNARDEAAIILRDARRDALKIRTEAFERARRIEKERGAS
jgi:F-type H+-transporting ATPase subunit b